MGKCKGVGHNKKEQIETNERIWNASRLRNTLIIRENVNRKRWKDNISSEETGDIWWWRKREQRIQDGLYMGRMIEISRVGLQARQIFTALYQCREKIYYIWNVYIFKNVQDIFYAVTKHTFCISWPLSKKIRYSRNHLHFQWFKYSITFIWSSTVLRYWFMASLQIWLRMGSDYEWPYEYYYTAILCSRPHSKCRKDT